MQNRLGFLLFILFMGFCSFNLMSGKAFADFGYMEDPFADFAFSGSPFHRGRSQEIISLDLDPQNILNSSFRMAARESRLNDLKLLLQKGAEINSRSSSGETALMYATKNCSQKLVTFLLQNGAEVNARDFEGRTPLIHAANGSCMQAVALLLKTPHVDCDAKDRKQKSAIDYASDNALIEVDGPSEEIIHMIQAAKRKKYKLKQVQSKNTISRSSPSTSS